MKMYFGHLLQVFLPSFTRDGYFLHSSIPYFWVFLRWKHHQFIEQYCIFAVASDASL